MQVRGESTHITNERVCLMQVLEWVISYRFNDSFFSPACTRSFVMRSPGRYFPGSKMCREHLPDFLLGAITTDF